MKIATVIPFARGIFREELTYFTALPVIPGMVVSVPIKNKPTDALVLATREASDIKTELRSSDFSLKKILKIKKNHFFLPAFIAATKLIADYHATTTGAVIKSLSTKALFSDEHSTNLKSPTVPDKDNGEEGDNQQPKQDRFVVQDSDEERAAFYKSLIREAFAKRTSVFLLLPTAADIEKMTISFGRGIDDYTVCLHNDLTTKELIAAWNKALDQNHPMLIIATKSFLSVPRSDIKTFIVDKEASGLYKDFQRPFIDARKATEIIARACGSRLVFGDVALRTETIQRTENGEFGNLAPLKYRSLTSAEQILIDLSGDKRPAANEPQTISPQLYHLIADAIENNERTFIFTARKGWSTATTCRDCGTTVLCQKCLTPLVIHQLSSSDSDRDKNYYVCHRCGEIRQPEDICTVCGGTRLILLGLGTERVVEELETLIPTAKILRLDSEAAKTKKQARDIINSFMAAPGSILIGTEMALYHLRDKVENIAVASIDPLLMLPDFRTGEKVFNLLLRLRNLASKKILVQTKNNKNSVVNEALSGHLLEFFREELRWRKELGYPPSKTLIKITLEGNEKMVTAEMDKLEQELKTYETLVFPAFTPRVRGKYTMNALIKLNPSNWPDQKLLEYLRSLPPSFIIDVDPDDIL